MRSRNFLICYLCYYWYFRILGSGFTICSQIFCWCEHVLKTCTIISYLDWNSNAKLLNRDQIMGSGNRFYSFLPIIRLFVGFTIISTYSNSSLCHPCYSACRNGTTIPVSRLSAKNLTTWGLSMSCAMRMVLPSPSEDVLVVLFLHAHSK